MRRKRIEDSHKGVGAPKVGGPFQLIDQDGQPFTEQDLKGRYSLVRDVPFFKTEKRLTPPFFRYILGLPIAPTSAPRSWTRWRGWWTWWRPPDPER
jgi:hypothetical protein